MSIYPGRCISHRLYEGTNTKRTTVSYYGASLFSLPEYVRVYDTDLSTVLKESHTVYNLDAAYTSRRIIGLAGTVEVKGRDASGLDLVSKVTYGYDAGNFDGAGQNISPVGHDGTNYGSGFVAGRGNLTSETRWNVESGKESNSAYAIGSSAKYNTAGAVVSQTTPWDGASTRTVTIDYTDSFNSGGIAATYAYPTKITDPAGSYSQVKYRYDIGANIEASSPAPGGQTYGKTTKRVYNDDHGRLQKDSVYINTTEKSYTRYEYPDNGIQSRVYSTITDTNANGVGDSADEVLVETWADGAGRVLKSRTEHPGSTGGWTASVLEYDVLGRIKKQSVPMEVDSAWTPAGDEVNQSWKFVTREYDWMGRTIRTINPDNTDSLASYQGCGCAGGLITTVQGELVNVPGQSNVQARRTQKLYSDILGRTVKVEGIDWSGGVYSTVKTSYNGGDQAIATTQYAGTDSSTSFQTTAATYDGHGRLKTRHTPEQDSGKNTIFAYYPDGAAATITDARGVTKAYSYNSRGLIDQISYTLPQGSTIPQTPTVTVAYDNAGNATQMSDGIATTTLAYNELSLLTSETKAFVDTMPGAPLTNNRFRIEYTYDLSGKLNSIKDPFGQQFNYSRDRSGRLKQVNGSSAFGGVTSYLADAKYRAWGVSKETSYGNGVRMQATFDQNLMTSSYTLSNPATSTNILRKEYEYYPDNNLRYSEDLEFSKFDRSYEYDFALRLVEARTGPEARGQTPANPADVAFREDFSHDQFGQMTSQTGDWRPGTSCADPSFNDSNSYVNNRNTNSAATYDADGRQLHLKGVHRQYNARGSVHYTWDGQSTYQLTFSYDGNGQEVKRIEKIWDEVENEWSDAETVYYIRATALGGKVLSEVASDGAKAKTYIYAGAEVLAEQVVDLEGNSAESVLWDHWDASGVARVKTKADGTFAAGSRDEIDPLGNKFNSPCFPPRPNRGRGSLRFSMNGLLDWSAFYDSDYGQGCFYDGVPTLCTEVREAIGHGGESVGDLQFLDDLIAVFSDIDGRMQLAELEQLTHGLEDQGGDDSILVDRKMAGTQDSSVTVKAGPPVYQIVRQSVDQNKDDDSLVQPNSDLTDCDKVIASLFGGPGAVAATHDDIVYQGIGGRRGDGRFMLENKMPPMVLDRSDHLAKQGVFHIRPDYLGTDNLEVALYVPKGAKVVHLKGERQQKSINGDWTNTFAFGWDNGPYRGVTVAFDHVGGTSGGQFGGQNLNSDFIRNRTLIGPTNAAGSQQVGLIGGLGGRQPADQTINPMNRHTHATVYKNGHLIDPRKVFCGWR